MWFPWPPLATDLICLQFNIVRVIKSRRLRWEEHLARMEEGWSAFKILTVKTTRNIALRRPRHSWENNIRMVFEK